MLKEVSIIPKEGLCNRLRAMVSGINIAKRLGARCVIYWNKTRNCNCRFRDLFEEPHFRDVSVVENRSVLHAIGYKRNLHIPTLLQKMHYDNAIYNFNWNSGESDIFTLIKPTDEKLLLVSCHQMYKLDGINRGGVLIPIKRLQERMNEVIDGFGGHTVGIHLRGTDNAISRERSPFSAFIDRMDKELDSDLNTKFYLATDEAEYKELLAKRYGARVITSPLVLNRSSLEGMKDALVDLYCLSCTDYIVGSYYSSYSEIAAEIGGIKLYRAMREAPLKGQAKE